MKRIKTRTAILSASGLLLALACGSGGGSADLDANHSALSAGTLPGSASADDGDEAEDEAEDEADDEEADDKVVCAVDADCDSDEVCTSGLCSDPPGTVDDADDHQNACGDDADDEDDDEADEADDDGPGDKLVCTVDADCDSDEVCANGKCR